MKRRMWLQSLAIVLIGLVSIGAFYSTKKKPVRPDQWQHLVATTTAMIPPGYDSITITAELRRKYPCAARLIKSLLPKLKYLATLPNQPIFNDPENLHLTFDISPNYITVREPIGATVTSGINPVFITSTGVVEYSAVIYLNQWYLKNATEEFMAANILHEVAHALITLEWGKHVYWEAKNREEKLSPESVKHDSTYLKYDTSYIKNEYRRYWSTLRNVKGMLNKLQDHEIIALYYVDKFRIILKPFYKGIPPSISKDTIIKAICFTGLQYTNTWKSLPGKGVDTCLYWGILISAARSGMADAGPRNCDPDSTRYMYHYEKSLRLRKPDCNN